VTQENIHADIGARVASLLGGRARAWFAAQLETTEATVSRLLSGKQKWNFDWLEKAAQALGVTVLSLMLDRIEGLSDEETIAVLTLRTRGYSGLAALALQHLQDRAR
jgi:hypothetical protein